MFINEEEKWEEKKEGQDIVLLFPIHIHFVPMLTAGLSSCKWYFVTSTLHLPPSRSGRGHSSCLLTKNISCPYFPYPALTLQMSSNGPTVWY